MSGKKRSVELPRLTSSLRAFSGLTAPYLREKEYGQHAELKRKREWQAKQTKDEDFSWQDLNRLVKKNVTSDNENEAKNALRDLLNIAYEVAGNDASSEVTNSTAMFLFQLLREPTFVSKSELSKVAETFGTCDRTLVDKAHKLTQILLNSIPENVLYKELQRHSKDGNQSQAFGEGIKFAFPTPVELEPDLTIFDCEIEEPKPKFSLKVNTEPKAGSVSVPQENREDWISTDSAEVSGDVTWLKQRCDFYFGNGGENLNSADMCSVIFDLLSSPRRDEEMQNELFELLGFDRFEFIQELLANRKKVVVERRKAVSFANALNANGKSANSSSAKPNFGCQVTIQSEQEKKLLKLVHKEEQKVLRRNKIEHQDMESHEDYLKSVGFDPEMMKYHREQALIEAANKPLFSSRSRSPRNIIQYPYVFDSMLSAQQSSAYVGGYKLQLPHDKTRTDCKMYEEFHLPPTGTKPPKETDTFITISSLDEVAKIGFKGVKQLNRVQSVVFDTAYNTNENLLICAPTGAGKTNVAMATILREVKQNIKQGVVMKDKFKIVYVAPMKALAAEMVRTFGRRLDSLGISVRELTGDMQLTKTEILNTQMLVTTPEKWDVVTRKSTGDVALTQIVKLLIIDEVHLLHDERGSVIECLVARTLRQVESTQNMIRIVGLSATLPNYHDVARFLRVNPRHGLFFFDSRFRPVPLGQTFIGIKARSVMGQLQDMDIVCYEKVVENVENGHQVMVFVHARNATVRTAMTLREKAKNNGTIGLFQSKQSSDFGAAQKQVRKSRNKELRELFEDGFCIHHAGMLRSDRNMVEDHFARGLIKVLVCTATLAWGVNLPAHAVVIKGTEIYDAKKGSFVDLGILDVLQIFGRAGRPQFDKFGHGYIITKHEKLSHYLTLMTRQSPIESQFQQSLADSLNAEISLGTITNVEEAVEWLSYTYLYIRMLANPMAYGIPYGTKEEDPFLDNHRRELIESSARALDKAKMIRFDERTSYLSPIDIGRIASNFYIKYDTIEIINENFKSYMGEEDIFYMISLAQEFEQIKVREEEFSELKQHLQEHCEYTAKGGVENSHGKTNILLQTYISRGYVECFSLASDFSYIAQNSARIVRGLFELALKKGWPGMSSKLVTLSKCIDKRMWFFENPLRQFPILNFETLNKLEQKNAHIERLRDMSADDIGHLIHHVRMGKTVKHCVDQFPSLSIVSNIQPVTRSVLRVRLTITAEFEWNDRIHGGTSEPWWIWVEDPDNDHIYHSEYFLILKKQVRAKEPQTLVFTIPIFEPLPSQYLVRAISDRWLGAECVCAISFKHLILPEKHPPHTDLLDLRPLPVTALRNRMYERLFKFSHFNPVQTQVFHTLYHTDHNVLLGAPTGSGKTIVAEMAIFRVFSQYPKKKAVYIAPLKALVRERIEDWKIRFEQKLKKSVVELTGDVTPDMRAISKADVIVTTPEKWDGVSRSWQTRNYVQDVALLVIDEIHLLGDERGPVLEVIVSRTNFISSHTEQGVRVVGLSTALANARDLADWLGIKQVGLFNFRPSVRPVPLQVHINGFPGKHYCPRMATMNKPTFAAIRTHSPDKPALIFVSSRRQTRLTALDLIAYLAAENDPKQWLHMPEEEIANVVSGVKDENLRFILPFGIAMHHAGLHERDRKIVEELFVNQKVQILIATSTLAWGVNFPAHLVVVKGTEYFDGKTKRYVDFPVTDVLQMMGRAGRPQFDDQGVAVILVQDIKKQFYKKFLYDPFPVESSLPEVLSDHINAEVVSGTITSKQDAMDYITWTYFFRRLLMNPSYYDLDSVVHEDVNKFLSTVVQGCVRELESSYCLEVDEDGQSITPTILGRISSYYYLSHLTLRLFREQLHGNNTLPELLKILSNAQEYDQLPVRHNEDGINTDLAKMLPLEVDPYTYDSPHTKTYLLLQAHFARLKLPCSDYHTDTKSVLDQAIRILQAMVDVSADGGWLTTVLRIMLLVQMIVQARWVHECPLLTLPGIDKSHLYLFKANEGSSKRSERCIDSLPELAEVVRRDEKYLHRVLNGSLSARDIDQISSVLSQLPKVEVKPFIRGVWEGRAVHQEKRITLSTGRVREENWMQVHADQEYVVRIEMNQISSEKKKFDSKAHAPRFSKVKDAGWWLVLGVVDDGELLALKRIGAIKNKSTVSLAFYTPEEVGHKIYTLYFMSDSYIGLDQQFDICLDVIEASIESQVNTEMKFDER